MGKEEQSYSQTVLVIGVLPLWSTGETFFSVPYPIMLARFSSRAYPLERDFRYDTVKQLLEGIISS